MQVDLVNQVVPLLRLARTAVLLDDMLRDVDESRAIDTELDAALEKHRLTTGTGASIADELGWALGLAVDLLLEADENEGGQP